MNPTTADIVDTLQELSMLIQNGKPEEMDVLDYVQALEALRNLVLAAEAAHQEQHETAQRLNATYVVPARREAQVIDQAIQTARMAACSELYRQYELSGGRNKSLAGWLLMLSKQWIPLLPAKAQQDSLIAYLLKEHPELLKIEVDITSFKKWATDRQDDGELISRGVMFEQPMHVRII